MSPSLWQIVIVVGIALIFFGPKRLPGLGKSMGEAIRGFKKGVSDDEIDVTDSSKKEKIDGDGNTQQTASKEKEKTEKLSQLILKYVNSFLDEKMPKIASDLIKNNSNE